MPTELSNREWRDHIQTMYARFKPSEDFTEPEIDVTKPYDTPQVVDLEKTPVGTVISIQGLHPNAAYTAKVENGKRIKIWRNYNAEGLIGPIDAICSYREELDESRKVVDSDGTVLYGSVSEKYVLERGVMRLGSAFAMPYFEYETDSSGRQRVKKPTDAWVDTCESITVQFHGNVRETQK